MGGGWQPPDDDDSSAVVAPDAATGDEVWKCQTSDLLWEGELPTGSEGTSISYVGPDVRQYTVISAGGARYNLANMEDYVVAFALPG